MDLQVAESAIGEDVTWIRNACSLPRMNKSRLGRGHLRCWDLNGSGPNHPSHLRSGRLQSRLSVVIVSGKASCCDGARAYTSVGGNVFCCGHSLLCCGTDQCPPVYRQTLAISALVKPTPKCRNVSSTKEGGIMCDAGSVGRDHAPENAVSC